MVGVVTPLVHTDTHNLSSMTDLRRAIFELKAVVVEHRLIEKSYDNGFWKLASEAKALRDSLKELEEQNGRLTSLIYNSPDAMILMDLKGTIVDWNMGAEQTYGFKDTEILGKSILGITHKDAQKDFSEHFNQFERGETVISAETRRVTKDGRVLDVALSFTALKDAEGHVIAVCTTERDITRYKEMEEKCQRLSAFIENSGDAIIALTIGGIVTEWNRGAEKIYGYTAKEVIGRPIFNIIPVSFSCELPGIIRRIVNGEGAIQFKTNLFRKDGKPLDISILASAIEDTDHHVIGISWTARDITDIKGVKTALIKKYDVNNHLKEHTFGL